MILTVRLGQMKIARAPASLTTGKPPWKMFSLLGYAAAEWPFHFQKAQIDSANALLAISAKLYNVASKRYEM